MERLKKIIEQHNQWHPLDDYISRIEAHIESDFSLAVENAKALLETIGKEICEKIQSEHVLDSTPSINKVLKIACLKLKLKNESIVQSISTSLANVGQEMGNLRNAISPTSHGKTLEGLKTRNDGIDLLTREFLIDSTIIIALFLIRAFEAQKNNEISLQLSGVNPTQENQYDEKFNAFWDEQFGEFEMGEDYCFLASDVLFQLDPEAYQYEQKQFNPNSALEKNMLNLYQNF